jgi:protein disulfide-isomerase
MKASWLGWSLLSLLAVPTLAASSESESKEGNNLVKRWGSSNAVDPETPSVFNGLDVPPLFQLTSENFEEATKDGTWSVL